MHTKRVLYLQVQKEVHGTANIP